MSAQTLAAALKAEETLLKASLQSESLFGGLWTAYCNPQFPTFPAWNAIYPSSLGASLSDDQLKIIHDVYGGIGSVPHIVDTSMKANPASVSQDEYFHLPPTSGLTANLKQYKLTISPTKDIELFSKTLQQAFGYDDKTYQEIKRQVRGVMSQTKTFFMIIKRKKSVCATSAVTLTPEGTGFISFGGVVPQFRNNGIPKQVFLWSAQQFKVPLFTHTAHELTKRREMPKCGFVSLGTTHLVPVSALMNKNSNENQMAVGA